jgi:hypothetical protein
MRAPILLLLLADACVLSSDHVSTELHAICTEDVPLPFEPVSPTRAVARVEVEDVGATIEAPDASATLDTVVLEAATGIDDIAFADAMEIDLLAPGFPDARVAEVSPLSGESPLSASGDDRVDLVDYLTADSLEIRIAFTGQVPDRAFLAILDACIAVDGIVVEDEE